MLYRLLRGKSVCYQVGVLRMTAKTLILVATPLLKCFVLLATPCGKFENKKSVTSSLEWRELSRAVWMSFIHLIDFILLIGVLFASEMAENLTPFPLPPVRDKHRFKDIKVLAKLLSNFTIF